MTRLGVICALCLLALGISNVGPVSAAPANRPVVGISVSPAVQRIAVNASQTSVSFPVIATNRTTKSAVLYLTTNDFTSLNQSGAVSFYGKDYNPATNPHGLAAWLRPALTQIALSPGQSKTVPVTIANLNALAIGGHYGAIVYFVEYPSGTQKTQAQVSNNQVLSTLVFLTTGGQGTQNLQFKQSFSSGFYAHWPSDVQFVLANVGNTQTTPRGTATIQSFGGRRLAKGLINADSGLILPGGERLFDVSLQPEHTPHFLGHEQVVISYHSDGFLQSKTYTKSFWYVNIPLLVALLLFMVLVGLLIRLGRRRHTLPSPLRALLKRGTVTAPILQIPVDPIDAVEPELLPPEITKITIAEPTLDVELDELLDPAQADETPPEIEPTPPPKPATVRTIEIREAADPELGAEPSVDAPPVPKKAAPKSNAKISRSAKPKKKA